MDMGKNRNKLTKEKISYINSCLRSKKESLQQISYLSQIYKISC